MGQIFFKRTDWDIMPINVGTVVTRYNSREGLTCDDGACVGRIVEIEPYADDPGNVAIDVKWMQSCNWHDYSLYATYTYMLDELWEIGQIPQQLLS